MSYKQVQHCISCILFNQRPPLIKPLQVLLIQREKDPFKGRWTLPGGRQEAHENWHQATIREMLEETGISVELLHP